MSAHACFYSLLLCPQSLQERRQLPIASKAEEVVAAIQANQVVIVRGSTGCGKTTQVSCHGNMSLVKIHLNRNFELIILREHSLSPVYWSCSQATVHAWQWSRPYM